MQQDLVYDVGLNNGDDTAYYLARGYRVVAIEADPTLIDACAARFADSVKSGRLTLLNCAVGPENTTAKFFICPTNRVWNSFDAAIAGRDGATPRPIDVRVRRFRDVLAEHGVPMYLKVDIEGYDHYCLADVDAADRPRHVSWELTNVDEIVMMQKKGYNAFRIIDQTTFSPLELGGRRGTARRPMKAHGRDLAFRVLMSVPGAMGAARTVRRTLRGGKPAPAAGAGQSVVRAEAGGPALTVRRIEWPGGSWAFPLGSSGPFGDDLRAPWLTADEAIYRFLDIHVNRRGELPYGEWYDVHATALPPGQAPRLRCDA